MAVISNITWAHSIYTTLYCFSGAWAWYCRSHHTWWVHRIAFCSPYLNSFMTTILPFVYRVAKPWLGLSHRSGLLPGECQFLPRQHNRSVQAGWNCTAIAHSGCWNAHIDRQSESVIKFYCKRFDNHPPWEDVQNESESKWPVRLIWRWGFWN